MQKVKGVAELFLHIVPLKSNINIRTLNKAFGIICYFIIILLL